MDLQGVWQRTLTFCTGMPIVVEPVEAHLSSDAGLLPIRQLDEQLGLTERFAAALLDRRDGPTLTHSFVEMTRSRVYGIVAGYEDQNDHDALRSDAVFKLIADRLPDDDDLASQPTLSRFENAIGAASLLRLQDVFIDQFLASFAEPPTHLTFDVDVFDDPTHGQQQLTFYHGFYKQYQYLPRVITCAENDLVVMVALLFGTASPRLGLINDLRYLIGRVRAVWPDVRITLRGDSGFAAPGLYDVCDELRLDFTIGLGMNAVLKRCSDSVLAEAVRAYETTGKPQRLFTVFEYQAETWSHPRWVVVKAEANAQGTNRRAVVSNRPGVVVLPGATYDDYTERGESENRNKELKCGLSADRLSDHRYLANLFRLNLHSLSANLLVRLRQVVAAPPRPLVAPDLPTEALAGPARRQYFNRRRDADPLGEAHPATWRMRLIKVAAEIVQSSRRIWIRLSGSWPFLDHFRQVCDAISACGRPAPGDTT
jgi:DDE family transposase